MTRVLRIYHGGRDAAHRRRERALVEAGVEVELVVPRSWPGDPDGAAAGLRQENFVVHEVDMVRPGDVNRHRCADPSVPAALLRAVRPDVLDLHEEPFSAASRQWLAAAGELPVVGYAAQNLDKRFPPPFSGYEQAALRRLTALYPCSRQAASVARGKGFASLIDVLPLGYDPAGLGLGGQSHEDSEFRLGLVGRMVPEKGVTDAVRVLAAVRAHRSARLHLLGEGPELAVALRLAGELGVADAVQVTGWGDLAATAAVYKQLHVLLVPSRSTATWVEQYGRVITEGQACGCVVAGYDSGAIREAGGGVAALVGEGDVEALALAVTSLATSPERWAELRSQGAAVAASCTWAAVGPRQASLYRTVLHTRDPANSPVPPQRRNARQAARSEFGPPARTLVADRPFALPVLRSSRLLHTMAATVVDAAVALKRG